MIGCFKIRYLLVLLPFLLSSCADKDKNYDKKKAVSIFAAIDPLKIDSNLEKVQISLPKQQNNDVWNGSSSEVNQRIENLSKTFSLKKKFWKKNSEISLKESSQIWASFNYISKDDFVFSPVIKDDKIFLLNSSGSLLAYNLTTKKRIWKSRVFQRKFLKNYQNPKIYYSNEKIFAIAGINKIAAVNAVDGKVLWSKDIASIPVSAPVCDGESVFVTTNDNKIYALNADDGKLQWVVSAILRNTAILGAADPIIYQDFVIASFSSGEIYKINKKTGETLWSQDLNVSKANSSDFYLNDIDATSIIKDETVYSIGNGGLMMAIDVKSGNYKWRKEIAGITDFWIADDFIYVINNDNKLLAIYRKTGGVKWIVQLPHFKKDKKPQTKIIYNGVVMAGDKLVISDVNGDLLVASPFDGKVEKTFKSGERIHHSPIIVGGKIYLHRLGSFMIDLVEIE